MARNSLHMAGGSPLGNSFNMQEGALPLAARNSINMANARLPEAGSFRPARAFA